MNSVKFTSGLPPKPLQAVSYRLLRRNMFQGSLRREGVCQQAKQFLQQSNYSLKLSNNRSVLLSKLRLNEELAFTQYYSGVYAGRPMSTSGIVVIDSSGYTSDPITVRYSLWHRPDSKKPVFAHFTESPEAHKDQKMPFYLTKPSVRNFVVPDMASDWMTFALDEKKTSEDIRRMYEQAVLIPTKVKGPLSLPLQQELLENYFLKVFKPDRGEYLGLTRINLSKGVCGFFGSCNFEKAEEEIVSTVSFLFNDDKLLQQHSGQVFVEVKGPVGFNSFWNRS